MTARVLMLGCLLVLAPPATAEAQYLSLGLRGGASRTTMSVTELSPTSRTGFLVGPTATLWFSDAFGIQFDALYVGKGFDPAEGTDESLGLSYLDVPIVALFHLPPVARGFLQGRLQAGPSFGFRVRCNLEEGATAGLQTCNPDNVSTFDFGLIGGVGLKIGRGRGGVTIDATYTHGLLDANIADPVEGQPDFSARNRALMLSVGIVFPIM